MYRKRLMMVCLLAVSAGVLAGGDVTPLYGPAGCERVQAQIRLLSPEVYAALMASGASLTAGHIPHADPLCHLMREVAAALPRQLAQGTGYGRGSHRMA